MTRRQVRELLILIIVVALGLALGMLVRAWMARPVPQSGTGGSSIAGSATGGPTSQFVSIPNDRIVARFQGNEITGEMLNKLVDFNLGTAGLDVANLPPAQVNFVRRQTLNQFVEDHVLEVYAKEQGIEVPAEDVDAKIAEVREGYASDEEFEKDITDLLHISREELRAHMYSLLLKQRVISTFEPASAITEEQVDKEFANFLEQMKDHPGGPVEITKDEVRKNLEEQERRRAYESWMAAQIENADLEVLEPSLVAPPIAPGSGASPHEGAPPPPDEVPPPRETSTQGNEESPSGDGD